MKIEGVDHVGTGGASNKKDAEAASARDMLAHLVESGFIPQNAVPPNMMVCIYIKNYLYLCY